MTDVLNLLHDSPFAFTATATVVGLMVGSFLNVVIHRLPRMMQRDWNEQAAMMLEDAELADCAARLREKNETPTRYNLVIPRSRCPKCGHQIRAHENYFALRDPTRGPFAPSGCPAADCRPATSCPER